MQRLTRRRHPLRVRVGGEELCLLGVAVSGALQDLDRAEHRRLHRNVSVTVPERFAEQDRAQVLAVASECITGVEILIDGGWALGRAD